MKVQFSRLWQTAALAAGLACVASAQTGGTQPAFDSKTVLVKFKPGSQNVARIAHVAIGARVGREIPQIGVQAVKVPAGWTVQRTLNYYKSLPTVQYAEKDYLAKADATVNDPLYSQQYWLDKVGAPTAWDLSMGDPKVRIAIIDSGVDYTHEDLAGKVELGHDFAQNDNDPMDVDGHGTHCAGIAAAKTNNGVGGAGLGYTSSIVAIRVLGDDGTGAYDWIIGGILDAVDRKVDVISMSLGGSGESQAMADAVKKAWDSGIVIVAASGNANTTVHHYPAAIPECIAVGASDSNDQRADFSNYGADWVDVAAPGVGILSSVMGNKYEAWDGTSMACPVVAGLAGLMKSYNPTSTNQEVREAIESTTVDVGNWIQFGRIDAPAAIAALIKPVPFTGDPNMIDVPRNKNGFPLGLPIRGTVNDVSATDSVSATVKASPAAGYGWFAAPLVQLNAFDPAKFIKGTLTVRHKSVPLGTTSIFIRNYAMDEAYPFEDPHFDLIKSVAGSYGYTTTQVTLPNDKKNSMRAIGAYVRSGKMQVVVRSTVPVRLARSVSAYEFAVDRVVLNGSLKP